MHGTIYVICNIYVLSYTGKMQHIKNVVENRGGVVYRRGFETLCGVGR